MPTSHNMILSEKENIVLFLGWHSAFIRFIFIPLVLVLGYISKCSKESVDKGNLNKLKQKNRTSRH